MNLISKLPILGFNSLPTQKSNPNEPWLCLSTSSPRILQPNLPFKYKNVLTKRAMILTEDHKGQNSLANELT